jgi:lipoprotein-anchoring transpeptidase ErfK/SrfK
MIRTTPFILVAALASFPAHAKWHAHKIHVTPGVPMRAADIKPYEPPHLDPEPPLEPSTVKAVEVTPLEAMILIRPWSSPMVGNAIRGAKLPVKGVVKSNGRGCSGKVWYALEPFGYLCSREAEPTDDAPSTDAVLKVRDGERLPFHYVMVFVKDEEKLPMWGSLDELKNGTEPERQLKKGDTIAVEKTYSWDNEKYYVSVDGKVIPAKGAGWMGGGSEWHGIEISDELAQPFGWITPDLAKVFAAPVEKGLKTPAIAALPRRTRVAIADDKTLGEGKKQVRWLRVTVLDAPPQLADAAAQKKAAEAQAKAAAAQKKSHEAPLPTTPPEGAELWLLASDVNEVRKLEVPATVSPGVTKWIDVDLGEQVLVAYEGPKPVFATLVSSGRAIPTPMGTYPVWAKVSAITMKNQPYEDKEYFVHKVPWSTFFQWHNAIHGAYWHDKFGVSKSHGCVNVSPLDARHVFEWVTPPLPPGWTGLRPLDLLQSPTVVVRNSHAKKQFRQDRPIGPPDKQLEADRLEEAEKRRADEAAAANGAATGGATTGGATTGGATTGGTATGGGSPGAAPAPATPAPAATAGTPPKP